VGHLLGYARVSGTDENPQLQGDELAAAGCWKLFTDTASGALARRPELDRVLGELRDGDTLVVWRLDRLGRSPAVRSWTGCWASCGTATRWWCGAWTGWAARFGT